MSIETLNKTLDLTSTTTTVEHASEASTTVDGTSAVPPDIGSFMYQVMGSVLGAVFLIIVLISVAFFVKQHRKRKQNVELLRNRQRNQADFAYGIHQDEDNVVHATHHPLYGQNVKRDNHDANLTLNCDSSATRNGTYANSGVAVNPDSMYDLPRQTGSHNAQNKNRNEESPECLVPIPSKMSTFAWQRLPNFKGSMEEMTARSGNGHLHASTLFSQKTKKKRCEDLKTTQSLGRFDMETRKTKANIATDEHECDEYPDYENSPEKVRKVKIQQGSHLTTVPPSKNDKMVGLQIQDDSAVSKSLDKIKVVRQKSDYEDPDSVVKIQNIKKKEDSKDGIPDYSNLIMPGLVVKGERNPSQPTCDYENEDTVKEVRRNGPLIPKRRAHTTTTFDRPNRPVVQKRDRLFSNLDHVVLELSDDMYVPMIGAPEEDDMYLPMDSHNGDIQKSFSHQPKPLPKSKGNKEQITKPKPLPRPVKQMVPKRSFDKNVLQSDLQSDRPPPCGVNLRSSTEYVNYDDSPRYINLFRSKSNDDVYIYADSHFNYE